MPAPLRSMTGFARVRHALADGELAVSVKSVNHRALDLAIQSSSMLDPFEGMIRTLVKAHISRGHVEVRVSIPKHGAGAGAFTVNREFLQAYLAAFKAENDAHGLNSVPDLNAALRIPGMLSETIETGVPEGTEMVLSGALAAALDELNAFRTREGADIGRELQGHNAEVATAAQEMERLREGTVEAYQARLTERLREITKGVVLDPQRLAQEAALLADRSDIGEEIARLRIHSGQLGTLLGDGGEVGKKLDFLLQEMNRETNTILSKTNGAGEAALRLTELGLRAKSAIEKIREQSLNLE